MLDLAIKHQKIRQNIIDNAHKAQVQIDIYAKPDNTTVKHYLRHLQDCLDYPTLGFLVKKEYINTTSINHPNKYYINKQILDNNEDVLDLKEKIRKNIDELYPKTQYQRKFIIRNKRISLYWNKPIKPYTKLDKLKIALYKFIREVL